MINKTQKFFSMVLVLTMLAASFAFGATGAETQHLIISDGTGKPGETVTLTISMNDIANLKTVELTVRFDKTAFIIDDQKPGATWNGIKESPGSAFSLAAVPDFFNDDGEFRAILAVEPVEGEATEVQKTALIVNFTIREGAAARDYDIELDGTATTEAGAEILGAADNGKITVEAATAPTTNPPSNPPTNPTTNPPTNPPTTGGGGGTYIPKNTPTPTPTVTPVPTAATATDIGEVSWATEYIADVMARGIMKGYVEADGSVSFKPSGTATRAEFATALFNYLSFEKDGTAVFADTQDHWAKDYIAKMVKAGIISGYNDTQFGPQDPITREQMATILSRAFKPQAGADGFAYTDGGEISSWATDSVYAVRSAGWMSGDAAGTFRPTATATRAEIATIFSRLAKAGVK